MPAGAPTTSQLSGLLNSKRGVAESQALLAVLLPIVHHGSLQQRCLLTSVVAAVSRVLPSLA